VEGWNENLASESEAAVRHSPDSCTTQVKLQFKQTEKQCDAASFAHSQVKADRHVADEDHDAHIEDLQEMSEKKHAADHGKGSSWYVRPLWPSRNSTSSARTSIECGEPACTLDR